MIKLFYLLYNKTDYVDDHKSLFIYNVNFEMKKKPLEHETTLVELWILKTEFCLLSEDRCFQLMFKFEKKKTKTYAK